jgi:hypothetical protein
VGLDASRLDDLLWSAVLDCAALNRDVGFDGGKAVDTVVVSVVIAGVVGVVDDFKRSVVSFGPSREVLMRGVGPTFVTSPRCNISNTRRAISSSSSLSLSPEGPPTSCPSSSLPTRMAPRTVGTVEAGRIVGPSDVVFIGFNCWGKGFGLRVDVLDSLFALNRERPPFGGSAESVASKGTSYQ